MCLLFEVYATIAIFAILDHSIALKNMQAVSVLRPAGEVQRVDTRMGSLVQFFSFRETLSDKALRQQRRGPFPQGSKGPKYGVCRVSILGIVTMVLGTYLLFGSLDP